MGSITVKSTWSAQSAVPLTKLRARRRQQLFSLRGLADESGVHFNTIARLERGETAARMSTVRRLAFALNVQPDDLY